MSRARSLAALAVVASFAALTSPAAAEDAPRFGERGQLAISNDFDLSFLSRTAGGGSTTTLSLAPAADYFVLPGLSLGAQVSWVHTDGSGTTTNDVGVGPRVGLVMGDGDHFSFWPRVAALFGDTSASTTAGAASTSGSITTFDVQVYAPVLWHPRPHFFLGLGPFFQTDLVSTLSVGGASSSWQKTTTYGVKLDLGGWTLGAEPHDSPGVPPVDTPPPEARFGDRGVLSIGNDVDLSLLAQSITQGGASSWTLSVAPGVDYFVVRGLSVGGQLSYAHTSTTKTTYTDLAFSPPGSFTATASTDTFGGGPRVGYATPLGAAASFWPRLALLYVDSESSTTPAGASGSTKVRTFDIQLFAPVLWHMTHQFFVGLGPFLQVDAAPTETVDGKSVDADKVTTIGAKLALGGWL